ncbi:hypothetical protein ASF12_20510 [Paenibacillus sp. Leaf72]|nr:hypothetical protein ASF12_20510 [Paenibacillus sp. Leaf72]
MRTRPDYCNECRAAVHFRYVKHDADSVYARCVECGALYDLINNGRIIREFRPSFTRRLAYYLHKVNAYGTQRNAALRGYSTLQPPASRYKRLLAYKAAMKERAGL